MARRSPTGRSRRMATAVRRKRVWARSEFELDNVAAAGNGVDLLADLRVEMGLNTNPMGLTVGGMLIEFGLTQNASQANTFEALVMGCLVTSETAVADVELPATNPHADWLWYQTVHFVSGSAGARQSTFDSKGGPIIVRAKRRMDEIGMNLFFMAEADGANTYDLKVTTSTLLLLP